MRALENIWIPMSDGATLAARVWMPDDATENPVPALLEYLPYRKRDKTRIQDEATHPHFAAHGYACLRVDIRGYGDSDGYPLDEYHPQQCDDGLEVINWISEQPWCAGAVGMFGYSWGGINALQIACAKPTRPKSNYHSLFYR